MNSYYKNINNVYSAKNTKVFNYNIGHGLSDSSLSGFVKCYQATKNVNVGIYNNIRIKLYDSYDSDIPTSSFINNNIGDETTDSIIVFEFSKFLLKDGIAPIKKTHNVHFNMNCVYSTGIGADVYCRGINASLGLSYELYDVKISDNVGNIILFFPKVSSMGNIDFDPFDHIPNLVVGKVFYDEGLIVLDSVKYSYLRHLYIQAEALDCFISYPYPTITPLGSVLLTNLNIHDSTSVSGDIVNFSLDYYPGVLFNAVGSDPKANHGFIDVFVNNFLVINSIYVSTMLKQTPTYIEIEIDADSFNYSENTIIGDHKATEDNPVWFNVIGLYDIYNNLLAIAKTSMPLKKTNERNINLKFRVDV